VFCAAPAISLRAQTFTSLLSFDGTNGASPSAPLVLGTDGNFYSTTVQGGTNTSTSCGSGCGTVFKVTPGGSLTTLYSFCSLTNCADGELPGGLVLGGDGDSYGTAGGGPANSSCPESQCGTVFKISLGGQLTTLYNFCSQANCTDGEAPGGLLLGSDGNFYGTSGGGGANDSGTVFKITPAGKLTTLYSFCSQKGCADGSIPDSLIQGTDGNFYGTTSGGDAGGTVFKITPAGALTTLYDFPLGCGACTSGNTPAGSLIQGTDGNFYGTTYYGGSDNECSGCGNGTIFKITPSGTLTTLLDFNGADGAQPEGGLIQATDGNFYGTTAGGGSGTCSSPVSYGCGTVFEITPTGTLTTLYSFCSQTTCADGEAPFGALVQGTDGTYYGTTYWGGTATCAVNHGCGTVFSLSVGLGPFVETVPTSGAAGASVFILGNNLTGSTSVTFNGTVATFTVVSSTEITATVPNGATTGTVKVTTPGGPLDSNTPFEVIVAPGPVASLSVSSVVFPPLLVGSTSAAQTATLINNGNMTLTITSIAASGGFAESNGCGTTVAAGGSCAINVTFTPSAGGAVTGTLTIIDNSNSAAGATQKVTLSGTGQGFTISVATGSSTSQSVSPGGTATYMLNLASQGGLSGTVALSCSGAPSEAQCSESPSSVTLSGNGTGTAMISVSTASSSRVGWRMHRVPRAPGWWAASLRTWMALAMLIGMLGIGWARMHGEPGRKRRWDTACLALALVLLVAVLMPACGGGSSGSNSNGQQNQGTPAGTYNLTITGTYGMGSSTLSQTQSLTLTVN